MLGRFVFFLDLEDFVLGADATFDFPAGGVSLDQLADFLGAGLGALVEACFFLTGRVFLLDDYGNIHLVVIELMLV